MTASTKDVPAINGLWEIPYDSPKGEKAWRLIVKQKGAEILTTILRVDGDTGGLTGEWQDGKFVASHFDGARPGLIELTPKEDGSLEPSNRSEVDAIGTCCKDFGFIIWVDGHSSKS